MTRHNTKETLCGLKTARGRCKLCGIMKRALITGITGQDGSYLAEFLLDKGYEVHGIKRRSSSLNTERVDHVLKDFHERDVRLFLHHGDLADAANIISIIQKTQPDEIYNLGAQSHVRVSFEKPEYTSNSNAIGALRILEAIRILGLDKKTRFYQASSSEMFGSSQPPQNEDTPFYPRSPYGIAKLYAHWITVNYREAYDMFAVSGILFNHESPRRGETFITRKVARAAARIKYGLQNKLYVGNLEARRDWGHAKDYVKAMWLMLQHREPEDFVIATGEQRSVRELCELAFRNTGIEIVWMGKGIEEKGVNKATGEVIIEIDSRYFRPTEVDSLLGDATKAREKLGWKPSVAFDELIKEIIDSELEIARKEKHLLDNGFAASSRQND